MNVEPDMPAKDAPGMAAAAVVDPSGIGPSAPSAPAAPAAPGAPAAPSAPKSPTA